MPRFIVTLLSYQDVIVEADDEVEAEHIALYMDPDNWSDFETSGDIYVDLYDGEKPAFNQKEESK